MILCSFSHNAWDHPFPTIHELVHRKHGRKELFGLQSNQIVKRMRKLRSKLHRRRKMVQEGGKHNRTALSGVFLLFSDKNYPDILVN
jgi:hypothetical protein